MNTFIGFKCVTCGKEYMPDQIEYTCFNCGPILGTLDVLYDYDLLKTKLNRKKFFTIRDYSHWRYLDLLPIEKSDFIPSLSVGWTPIYKSANLEKKWNIKNIWIKDDGRNPTGSLKDRASSVAVVKAVEKNVMTVTAASTGNAASSWAAFTALANLKTIIFVPESTPKAKLAQLLIYGAKVVQVNGNYDDAYDLCCKATERWGWYNRSTAINPYLGEGKKTAALETCEQLDWQVPDYVFVSVGDGCILQGIWKGFQDLYKVNLIDRLPKLIGVQAENSAPLVKAWKEGKTTADQIIPETIADSIAVGIPRDQVKVLRAVRESNGRFITVTDDEILNSISLLAKSVGVLAEPAGAAGFAGLKKLVKEDVLNESDTVVVLVTGNGLKDIDGVLEAVKNQPVKVENSLDDVKKKLLL